MDPTIWAFILKAVNADLAVPEVSYWGIIPMQTAERPRSGRVSTCGPRVGASMVVDVEVTKTKVGFTVGSYRIAGQEAGRYHLGDPFCPCGIAGPAASWHSRAPGPTARRGTVRHGDTTAPGAHVSPWSASPERSTRGPRCRSRPTAPRALRRDLAAVSTRHSNASLTTGTAARRPYRFDRGRHVTRRCCTNRHWPARCQPTGSSPTDAIRRWSADGGHPIQDRAAEHGLCALKGVVA